MQILWITNIVFPEALTLLMGNGTLKSTGGWMLGYADALVTERNIKLVVASVSKDVKRLTRLEGERITYYLLPYGKGNKKYNPDYEHLWIKVRDVVQPDVVHIHGTEYSHGLAYIKSCGSSNVVISIQGLTSSYCNYYNYGISISDILSHISFRDIIRGTLFQEKRRFQRRGEYEKQMIAKVNHIIGRTSWDKAHVWAINPDAHYHFCNETLRQEFYDGDRWDYKGCTPYSIFVSQATYPIKGLHMLLRAMPLILKHYPNTQIRVAGMDVTRTKEGLMGSLKLSGYGKIIKSLIKTYQLDDHIRFLGSLDAVRMKNEYLHCNVFVCPSTIENSPNSLGEAQILGTPVVASYVGGIPDMMQSAEGHLYRFDEVEMLASAICDVFSKESNQIDLRDIAKARHDRLNNCQCLLNIYKRIKEDNIQN